MPSFKIHRLRESQFQQFRWAPHTSGVCHVKQRDYKEAGQVEAAGIYAAWSQLRDSGQPLRVGDILEDGNGALRVFKYVGFEEAQWSVPEPKPEVEESVPAGDPPES
jgi:hypothetical protein